MAKVSIIVPVYNVETYLHECMDSLIGQTLEDIEILCYDDCSDDGSGEILDEYAQKDERVHVVHYPDNRTAAQARKDGALAAGGEYIMYVDGDDRLEPNACERLAALMDQKKVDMIHFGTTVEHDGTLPESRIENLKKMLLPYCGKLKGNILDACFVDRKFHFQIWNKIYSAKVCKRAMTMFPDGRYSKAQDLFAFYLIAYFATSYLGIPDESYYVYGFGRGVTGHTYIGRNTIVRYAEQSLVVEGITQFLERLNVLELHRNSLQLVKERLLNDSMGQLYSHVAAEDLPFAFDQMREKWGTPAVIGHMAEKQLYQSKQWAERFRECGLLKLPPKKVKKIGTFYHSLCNGGAQRVVAELTKIWVDLGYEVVLYTDMEPSQDDYPIPDSVKRVILPAFDLTNGAARSHRAGVLYQSVLEEKIDLFIHQAWVAPSMLWDMLSVKFAGAQFYIHTHNIFSMPLLSNTITQRFFEMQSVYQLADGVIALSNTDAAYWKHFNPKVFTVVNPLTFDLKGCKIKQLTGKTVLWLGRISNEKNPIQAIEIFARVHDVHPDAKMLIVGSGSEKLEELMRRKIDEKELNDSVEMCGFHLDVEPFYQQADVFLCTSSYEGFSLTILEAQSHGIPCVSYEMPYLMLLEDHCGTCSVPMGNKDAAAEKINMLFDDREMLAQYGRDARKNVEEKCLIDYHALWQDIIHSTEQSAQMPEMDYEDRVIQTLSNHIKVMYDAQQKKITELTKKLKGSSGSPAGNVILDAADIGQLRFAPMPKHGPFKTLRRKLHTALRIVVLEGWGEVGKVIKEKIHLNA